MGNGVESKLPIEVRIYPMMKDKLTESSSLLLAHQLTNSLKWIPLAGRLAPPDPGACPPRPPVPARHIYSKSDESNEDYKKIKYILAII